jgi:hypothetical protein
MEETPHLWEDLVLAILSVNKYPLEKTYLAIDTLRREGLFQPQNLVRWSPEEIGNHLKRGGYDRGEFMTGQFASRLRSLGLFIKSAGVTECEQILRKGDTNAVKALLKPVKGIGPQVLINFSLLRNPSPETE